VAFGQGIRNLRPLSRCQLATRVAAQKVTMSNRVRNGAIVAGLIAAAAIWFQWPRVWTVVGGLTNVAASKSQAPPVPVSAARAVIGDFPIILSGLGVVQALQTVTVRSRVDGEIIKIAFQEGQMVRQGDLLAEIDRRPLLAALAQAQAKQSQDVATLAGAKIDLERYSALVQNRAVPRQQLDQQAATVNQLDFLVKADAALVEAASAQLDYSKITAPIGGRTGFRQVDEGNIVNATTLTGIVTITQVSPIGVVFTAPGQQFSDIRQALDSGAAEVVALTTDGDRELARGQLTLMDNQIDTTSGSIKLKAIFKNEKGELWPGLAVATRLQVALRENVVVVPDAALQRGRDGLFAFVVDATNKVIRRDVEVPLVADGKALVVKGIAAGEAVVTTGQYRLSPNMLVSVQEPKASDVLASDGPL
jgi:membrane fusion protein, multidrug efflux system